MHLSRLLLTGEQLHNPYQIHRTLWLAFRGAPEQARDFLFRVEQRNSQRIQVLVQSKRKPAADVKNARLLATKEVSLLLRAGEQLRFLLIANPVKAIADEQGRLNRKGEVKKCRIPLIKEEQQAEWLNRKLVGAAHINMVEIEKQLPLNFRKGRKRGKIQPYSFKGIIVIADAAILDSLINQGVGPAKAFGCGMLSLAGVRKS